MSYEFFGKQISGRFTIPSGIITTMPDTIARIARDVPAMGILTTKSIGVEPRTGNKEPIYASILRGLYSNAVGLANPGAEEYAGELAEIYPLDGKFLLASVFGKTPEEFQRAIRILDKCSDGFELNFSCPHAEPGYGASIGCSAELVSKYVKAIREVTQKPIVAKLTPNVDDIGRIARAAVEAGADGIAAINTVGPLETPLLSLGKGGLSGHMIKDIGVKAVCEIRRAVGPDIPIIGMGGIYTPADVTDYRNAGANYFGVGSSLTCHTTKEIVEDFSRFNACNDMMHHDGEILSGVNDDRAYDAMQYQHYGIKRIERPAADLKVFYFDGEMMAEPGQFVFTKVGKHEKPFSIADDEPLTLAVRKVGEFTSKLFDLKEGDKVAMRGPYGRGFSYQAGYINRLVGGGTGLAPVHFLAKELSKTGSSVTVFAGARSKDQLLFAEALQEYGRLVVATNDGSAGREGTVVDLLQTGLLGQEIHTFFNCGPEKMLKAAVELEKELYADSTIQALVERYMKCGVGICGACSTGNGLRTCVDGPVFEYSDLDGSDFGRRRRDASGKLIEI